MGVGVVWFLSSGLLHCLPKLDKTMERLVKYKYIIIMHYYYAWIEEIFDCSVCLVSLVSTTDETLALLAVVSVARSGNTEGKHSFFFTSHLLQYTPLAISKGR